MRSLGSDGYSSLVSGLTLATGCPFALVNVAIAVALIALAWSRGTRPGLGTLVQPVVVGVVVGLLLPVLPSPPAGPCASSSWRPPSRC